MFKDSKTFEKLKFVLAVSLSMGPGFLAFFWALVSFLDWEFIHVDPFMYRLALAFSLFIFVALWWCTDEDGNPIIGDSKK